MRSQGTGFRVFVIADTSGQITGMCGGDTAGGGSGGGSGGGDGGGGLGLHMMMAAPPGVVHRLSPESAAFQVHGLTLAMV